MDCIGRIIRAELDVALLQELLSCKFSWPFGIAAGAFSIAKVTDLVHVNPEAIYWKELMEGRDLGRWRGHQLVLIVTEPRIEVK